MQEALSNSSIDQLLDELTLALGEERAALLRVDASGIELAATRKAALSDELNRRQPEFTTTHRSQLGAIQTEVRHNLILLVHARDFVQGRLGVLTGRPTLPGQLHKPAVESVRLDLRG